RQVAAHQVVQALLRGSQGVAHRKRVIFGARQTGLDFETVRLEGYLLEDVLIGHAVELAIEPDALLDSCQRTLGLKDAIVGALDVVGNVLLLSALGFARDLAAEGELPQTETDLVLLRERLADLPDEQCGKTRGRANGGVLRGHGADAGEGAEDAALEAKTQ